LTIGEILALVAFYNRHDISINMQKYYVHRGPDRRIYKLRLDGKGKLTYILVN